MHHALQSKLIQVRVQRTRPVIIGEAHGDADHEDLARQIGMLMDRAIFFYEQPSLRSNATLNWRDVIDVVGSAHLFDMKTFENKRMRSVATSKKTVLISAEHNHWEHPDAFDLVDTFNAVGVLSSDNPEFRHAALLRRLQRKHAHRGNNLPRRRIRWVSACIGAHGVGRVHRD